MLPQKCNDPGNNGPPPPYVETLSGLQLLLPVNKVVINHDIDMLTHIPPAFRHCNLILDMNGRPLYFSQQIPQDRSRGTLGGSSLWTSFIFDRNEQVAFKLSKVFDEITVFAGDIKIGSVIKKFSLTPKFGIYNSVNKQVLKLHGNILGISLERKLKLETLNGQEIGGIKINYSDEMIRPCLSNINYSATFPQDLDVNCKAIIMAAMIIWDFDHSR